MKIIAVLLSSVVVATAGTSLQKLHKVGDIKADSSLGSTILSKARNLNDFMEEEYNEIEFTWVAEYSLKFQGCHHVPQWNPYASDARDVKIDTKRLLRFRLCPTDGCSGLDANGCRSGYGDYIIDLHTYLEAYFQAAENNQRSMCETTEKSCACHDRDDDFDNCMCLWDCFAEAGIAEICMDTNPYGDDEQAESEEFELREYVGCAQVKLQNPHYKRRQLEDVDGEEVQYFIGPYCADHGAAVYLGLFTDDACTIFADIDGGALTYQTLAGKSLPYSDSSIIGSQCVSCKKPEQLLQNNDANHAQDEDKVVEMCQQIYNTAGKCELNLRIDNPNTAACTYMEGIKIVRINGIIEMDVSKANPVASTFIGIFAVSFFIMAFYVYYLWSKLQRDTIQFSIVPDVSELELQQM